VGTNTGMKWIDIPPSGFFFRCVIITWWISELQTGCAGVSGRPDPLAGLTRLVWSSYTNANGAPQLSRICKPSCHNRRLRAAGTPSIFTRAIQKSHRAGTPVILLILVPLSWVRSPTSPEGNRLVGQIAPISRAIVKRRGDGQEC
jgi:hypothetical protein